MRNQPALTRDKEGRAYIRVGSKVAALIAGESDLSEWDEEEIARGQQRSSDGHFKRPPTVVPREVYQEFARRQYEQGFAHLTGHLGEMMATVVQFANDPELDESVRLKAIDMALNRLLGKPREKVDLAMNAKVEHAPAEPLQYVVNEDELWPDDDVVDAEIVEDDDDWNF